MKLQGGIRNDVNSEVLMKKNIFVVGLDDFHLSQLRGLRRSGEYRFFPFLSYENVKRVRRFPVKELLDYPEQLLKEFDGSVDAVIGYWDFPVSTVLPLIQKQFGHSGASLVSVLKCEHKYWSRVLQKEVNPALIPDFEDIDPFQEQGRIQCCLSYPFWLKPVKSVLSHLGFLIHNRLELIESLTIIRENIHRYAEPFNLILAKAELPESIAGVDGYHCIAEGLISRGYQCTLEGYVYSGQVFVYGVIDSIRDSVHQSTFVRYQYPSRLPVPVQDRMVAATEKIMTHIGYDNAPFNIEFYWDPKRDRISLLEINTRISKSHCPLFKMVDGEYHHDVLIDLALGRQPDFPSREGRFGVAAKFMIRRFTDGIVLQVPDRRDIEKVKEIFPGTEVLIHVHEGMRLSDMFDQDSYSYEIAVLYMGAEDSETLLANERRALSMLPFRIDHDENRQTIQTQNQSTGKCMDTHA